MENRALGRSCTSLQPISGAILPQYDLSNWVVPLNALMQLLDELQELWESWQRTSQMTDLLTLPLTHLPVCISSPPLVCCFIESTLGVSFRTAALQSTGGQIYKRISTQKAASALLLCAGRAP